MRFEFTESQLAWRAEVKDFLRENITPELELELRESEDQMKRGPQAEEFLKKVKEKGWAGLNYPEEYGGRGTTNVELCIFRREWGYAGAPEIGMTLTSIVPILLQVASEQMKNDWLPKILNGEVDFALGYSEPEAGSDLANLKTRAVLEGDEFIINGQKTWNSEAHVATHQWLACRTDPTLPKHKGVSIILVPIDAPGVTVRPIDTWGDQRVNEVFFDNVRVPKNNLVGEMNKGWEYAMMALNLERLDLGIVGDAERCLDDLIQYVKNTTIDGEALSKDKIIRHRIAELHMELEVCTMLCYAAAWQLDVEKSSIKNMSIIKVMGTELRARVGDIGTQIMDLHGQLRQSPKQIPFIGEAERLYRRAPMKRFGGGNNEIMRDVIAQMGLGLPRNA